MTAARTLYHLTLGDFLERLRRYSFLVALALMIAIAYLFVPSSDASYVTIDLDGYRGIYNSAWIGAAVAMLTVAYFSLIGFYVVKGAVKRDIDTGVGQIIATTPISKGSYLLGKWLSNLAVLVAMVLILVVASGAMQLIRNEVTLIDFADLVLPFLLVVLPAMTLVAALAIFFDVIPVLRGGFGNVVAFFLFVTLFFSAGLDGSSILQNMETGVAEGVPGHSGKSSCCLILESNAQMVLGRPLGTQQTFNWEGMTWAPTVLALHLAYILIAIGIVLLSAVIFRRFDPAGEWSLGISDRVYEMGKRLPRVSLGREVESVDDDSTSLAETEETRLTPLSQSDTGFRFISVLFSELRIVLKAQPWWWHVVALGLIVASLYVQFDVMLNWIWPIAWIWPILVWSSMGVRETRYRTDQFVFSAAFPLRRQLPATWLSGLIVAWLLGAGVLIRFIAGGELVGAASWAVGAAFIAALALSLGVWSKNSKVFEATYLFLWYVGPMQRIGQFDYMGLTSIASGEPGAALDFAVAAVALLALAFVGRRRQLTR